MRCLLVSLAIVIAVLCDSPVYVDELEDILRGGADYYELKMLDDNKFMTRSEKQKRLNEILARQPQQIQQQFNQKVQYEQAARTSEQQFKQRMADQQGVGDFMRQMIQIENDMTISSAEAEQREDRLKYQNPSAARIIDDLD